MTKQSPKPAKAKTTAGPGRGSKPARRAAAKPRAPQGRFTQRVCDTICERIATGNSLRSICEAVGMPSVTTVLRWLADETKSDFRGQYARAREAQADWMAEDILAIADEECTMVRADKHGSHDDGGGQTEVVFDPTAVARNRLRVDARKWLAAKMAPKKYGDKIEAIHTGAGGGAIQVQSTVTFVRPPARPEED